MGQNLGARCSRTSGIVALVTLLCVWSTPVSAAPVFGQVTLSGHGVAARISFTNQYSAKTVYVESDSQGRYQLFLAPGAYTVSSNIGPTRPHEMLVLEDPVRLDLSVRSSR